MTITATISARRTDAADRAGYVRIATIYRESGAATMVDTQLTPFTRESDNTFGARISVSGNNAIIEVNGAAGKTVNWKCWYQIVRV
jgi:hypothetical protein